MDSYYIISLNIVIGLMLFSKIVFRKKPLVNLFVVISLYIVALGLPYVFEIELIDLPINIQGYIIKLLVLVLPFDKRMILMIRQKKYSPFILVLIILLIVDIVNLKVNLLYYFNYLLYFVIILGINLYTTKQKELKKVMINMSYFFYSLMTIILIIKFSVIFTLNFREVRLYSIFGTADEEGAFYLVFMIIVFMNSYSKWIKIVVGLLGMFLLVFAIGTKTSLLSLLIVILIYFLKDAKVSKVLILAVLLYFSYEMISTYLLKDFTELTSSSNDNTLKGRIYGIWIPAFDYTIANSPFFGFGNKGWVEVSTNSGMTGGYYTDKGYMRSSHNIIIFYLAEWGLIGVLILINYFRLITKKLYRKLNNPFYNNRFTLSLFLSWVVLLISLMSSNLGISGWVFISIYFGISIIEVRKDVFNY